MKNGNGMTQTACSTVWKRFRSFRSAMIIGIGVLTATFAHQSVADSSVLELIAAPIIWVEGNEGHLGPLFWFGGGYFGSGFGVFPLFLLDTGAEEFYFLSPVTVYYSSVQTYDPIGKTNTPSVWYGVLPLFHRNTHKDGMTWFAGGLTGWVKRDNVVSYHWLFPLYGYSDHGLWNSTWAACGLWRYTGCKGFDEAMAGMDAERLSECAGSDLYERKGISLLFFKSEKDLFIRVPSPADTKDRYQWYTWNHTVGNPLLWDGKKCRRVQFDAETGAKMNDTVTSRHALLGFLFRSEAKQDRITGDVEKTRSLLGRLYRRTFRPDTGTERLDVCFIPVKRAEARRSDMAVR